MTPAAPQTDALPPGAKGVWAQIDRLFIVILAVSLGAHFAGVGWLRGQPVPEEPELGVEALEMDRFARVILPLPKPQATAAPQTQAKRPTETPDSVRTPRTPENAIVTAKPITKTGLLGVIGVKGEGNSALRDLFVDTSVTDVAKALAEAGGAPQVATIDDAVRVRARGDESGQQQGIELDTNRVGAVALEERRTPVNVEDTARPTLLTAKLAMTVIDGDMFSRWLSQRRAAIQSCYERELKRSPTLQGKVRLNFTIDERGRTDHIAFDEDTLRSEAVNLCLTQLIRSWRIPNKDATESTIQLPLVFTIAN